MHVTGVPVITTAVSLGPSSGVLNRVGHQQSKWYKKNKTTSMIFLVKKTNKLQINSRKRQVQEQRRNIYDRHTMLN